MDEFLMMRSLWFYRHQLAPLESDGMLEQNKKKCDSHVTIMDMTNFGFAGWGNGQGY